MAQSGAMIFPGHSSTALVWLEIKPHPLLPGRMSEQEAPSGAELSPGDWSLPPWLLFI
jgi:hypothetical protein